MFREKVLEKKGGEGLEQITRRVAARLGKVQFSLLYSLL
jgi:hypothetical protein